MEYRISHYSCDHWKLRGSAAGCVFVYVCLFTWRVHFEMGLHTQKKGNSVYTTHSPWLWDPCEICGVTDKIGARLEGPLIMDPHPRYAQVAKEVSNLLGEVAWGGNWFFYCWWPPIKPIHLLKNNSVKIPTSFPFCAKFCGGLLVSQVLFVLELWNLSEEMNEVSSQLIWPLFPAASLEALCLLHRKERPWSKCASCFCCFTLLIEAINICFDFFI